MAETKTARDAMAEIPSRPEPPIPVGISECLLGRNVRHDGGHKRSSLCHAQLEGLLDYTPFCPEVGIGLGVPREPIRLVEGADGAVRAVGVRDRSHDVTEALRGFAERTIPALEGLSGFVLMKGSPSCGMERVKVYHANGNPVGQGSGVFAERLMTLAPELPVEESGRLNDAVLRENFVTRVFLHAHWQALRAAGVTRKAVIAFHSRYKYLLMAHSQQTYRELGRLLAEAGSYEPEALADAYFPRLMAGMRQRATRKTHANVLSHLQGHLTDALNSASRQELAELIHAYRRGEVPLIVPITLMKHHFRVHPEFYALQQVYLEPHPPAHGLRNEL